MVPMALHLRVVFIALKSHKKRKRKEDNAIETINGSQNLKYVPSGSLRRKLANFYSK